MTALILILLLAVAAAHTPAPEPVSTPQKVVIKAHGDGKLPVGSQSWRVQQVVGAGWYVEVPADERESVVAALKAAGFQVATEWGVK